MSQKEKGQYDFSGILLFYKPIFYLYICTYLFKLNHPLINVVPNINSDNEINKKMKYVKASVNFFNINITIHV